MTSGLLFSSAGGLLVAAAAAHQILGDEIDWASWVADSQVRPGRNHDAHAISWVGQVLRLNMLPFEEAGRHFDKSTRLVIDVDALRGGAMASVAVKETGARVDVANGLGYALAGLDLADTPAGVDRLLLSKYAKSTRRRLAGLGIDRLGYWVQRAGRFRQRSRPAFHPLDFQVPSPVLGDLKSTLVTELDMDHVHVDPELAMYTPYRASHDPSGRVNRESILRLMRWSKEVHGDLTWIAKPHPADSQAGRPGWLPDSVSWLAPKGLGALPLEIFLLAWPDALILGCPSSTMLLQDPSKVRIGTLFPDGRRHPLWLGDRVLVSLGYSHVAPCRSYPQDRSNPWS